MAMVHFNIASVSKIWYMHRTTIHLIMPKKWVNTIWTDRSYNSVNVLSMHVEKSLSKMSVETLSAAEFPLNWIALSTPHAIIASSTVYTITGAAISVNVLRYNV